MYIEKLMHFVRWTLSTAARFNRMSRKLAKATFQMQLWSIFFALWDFLSARWDFFATSWDFLDVMGCFLQHPKLQPSSTFLSTLQCFEFPQQMALKASACFDWGLCWYLDFCQVTRDQFLSVFASFISLTIKRCHGNTPRRKTEQVQFLWELFFSSWQPKETHCLTRRDEVQQMWPMSVFIDPSWLSWDTYENTLHNKVMKQN